MNDVQRESRKLHASGRYLVVPRAKDRRHEGMDKLFVELDGQMHMSVHQAMLATTDPDFYSFLDLSLHQGKEITVTIEGPNARGIDLVRVTDDIPCRYPLYQEPGRPQVHFSPLRGWFNDPSGMIWFDGTWHLYFASKRFSNGINGPESAWGHAVSTDLLHWEELPIFLQNVRGEYSYYTGGAAVDVENTTGLGSPGKPALVFSANNGGEKLSDFTQCLFVSTDGGMTCTRNPEMMYKPLPAEESRRGGATRDPMILWWAPQKKWVMILYNHPPGGERSFFFYESRDLKNWTETSVLGGFYECPNLFELPVDGNPGTRHWVVWGSSTAYLLGTFDGMRFTPEGRSLMRTHFGQFSASQVFANAPNGRVVQIGWARCCNYEREFSQMASFPLDLSLRTTPNGVRLFAEFVPELKTLRMDGWARSNLTIGDGQSFSVGDTSRPMEVVLEFDPRDAQSVVLRGSDLEVKWDAIQHRIWVQNEWDIADAGGWVECGNGNNLVQLHLLIDIPSVEVTVNRGERYLLKGRDYRCLHPEVPLEIRPHGGSMHIRWLEVFPLKPIHRA